MENQPLSAPASRLLRGTHPAHLELEKKLAEFKGTEAALIFPTGYQANIGLLSALMGPQDRVLSDELNHASIIDGLRLSGAQKCIVPHLDLSRIEEELSRPHPGGKTFLLSESYFSMDGDLAPLARYAALAAPLEHAHVLCALRLELVQGRAPDVAQGAPASELGREVRRAALALGAGHADHAKVEA